MQIFLRVITLTFLFFIQPLIASQLECPFNVPQEAWERLTPYFLPDNHPIKPKLDKIFSSPDVLKNEATLKNAGFKSTGAMGYSKTSILKHKKLKKYLIKAFTDDCFEIVEYKRWMRRIDGARFISQAIENHGFQKIFKVPKKWIYQVPRDGISCEEKNFVLVVEDMELFDPRANNIMWNNAAYATKEKLEALYMIQKEVGLIDSIYINNIPFSIDERIAFVDTEYFNKWPVPYDRLTAVLPKKLQDYWTSLILSHP